MPGYYRRHTALSPRLDGPDDRIGTEQPQVGAEHSDRLMSRCSSAGSTGLVSGTPGCGTAAAHTNRSASAAPVAGAGTGKGGLAIWPTRVGGVWVPVRLRHRRPDYVATVGAASACRLPAAARRYRAESGAGVPVRHRTGR